VNLTPDEERVLIERLRRGDGRAFNEFVRQHQSTVYTLVLRLLSNRREDALDVSQEVFVTVFRAIADFRGDSRLSTWIHRIAVNHCRNRNKYLGRRQERRHDAFEDKHEGSSALGAGVVPPLRGEMPGPEQVYEGNEAERFVAAALDSLDTALAGARNQAQRLEHARVALTGALLTARSQIDTTTAYMASRRGRTGPEARTRLAEAERLFLIAGAEADPVVALDTARSSATYSRDADALARYDLMR